MLNDLKMKIKEELNLNLACYDIKIIYCYPQEVLHERLNYRYTVIKEDKPIMIMFNRIHKMPQVNAIELYVSSEPLATEEVQQITTSLQFIALDDGCITMGGYTLLFEETHLGEEDEDEDHDTNNSETLLPQETHLGEEDEEKDNATNNGENLYYIDEYE